MNLAKIKLNKFSSLIVLGISILSLNSCGAESQSAVLNDNQLIYFQKTTETLPDDLENEVSLRLINLTNEKAILELSNNSGKEIYIYYVPFENSETTSPVYHYGFRCQEKGKKEVNYNESVSHIIPAIEPLRNNAGFRFEVSPIPDINANCEVSMLYYDNEKAADLLNSPKIRFSEAENVLLDNAMKSVKVKFKISDLKK